MALDPIPEGFHTVTPYLVIRGVSDLIEYLQNAFDAVELHRTTLPDGTTPHAAVRIGNSVVMIGEAGARMKPVPACLYLYVDDTDSIYRKAIEAGGTSLMEPADQFYGDRNAGVRDPAGNQWWIATHVEDVEDDEIQRRAAER